MLSPNPKRILFQQKAGYSHRYCRRAAGAIASVFLRVLYRLSFRILLLSLRAVFLFLLYIIYHFTPVFPTCVSEPSIRFISAARSSSASLIIHLSMIRHKIKNRKIPMKIKSADSAFIRGNSRKKRTPPVHTQKNIKNRYRILHLVKNLKCILLYNCQTAVRNFRRNRAAKGQREGFLSISAGFRFPSPRLPSCRPGSAFS